VESVERSAQEEAQGMRRSLVGPSVLMASVCLAVDALSFTMLGRPGLESGLEVVLLLVIIAIDAALALPARFSGWVALAHGLANARPARRDLPPRQRDRHARARTATSTDMISSMPTPRNPPYTA
jgi:hypothetical protein